MEDYSITLDTTNISSYQPFMSTGTLIRNDTGGWFREYTSSFGESSGNSSTREILSLIRSEIDKAEVHIKTELIASIIPNCIKEATRLLGEGCSEAEVRAELMKLFFSI